MKFCQHCGKKILDEAVICPGCGCEIEDSKVNDADFSTESLAKGSLILGVIGIVFAWLFALVGHITSIIGIVIGIKEYKETNKITGLVLSIVGEVCSILSSAIGVVTVTGLLY